MTAEDSLAICMLLILAISAATLMTILFSLMKNAGKKDEIAELLSDEDGDEDSGDGPKGEFAGPGDEDRQPWEREADWWRQ